MGKHNIIFVGVFTDKSTNVSQAEALESLGYNITTYSYRERLERLGNVASRDTELKDLIKESKPDLVIFSKCNNMDVSVVTECNKYSSSCLWYMDPCPGSQWNGELLQKVKAATFMCCDKLPAVKLAKQFSKNVFHIIEGFDHTRDFPHELDKSIDVSFIGSLYNGRDMQLAQLGDIKHFDNVYGEEHAKIVSKSKINLNFCTNGCASDRIYKILGAGGFLLTDDWSGREETFIDGEHLVIFKGLEDLKTKLNYYLSNPNICKKIAKNGLLEVQRYSRVKWAESIIETFRLVHAV